MSGGPDPLSGARNDGVWLCFVAESSDSGREWVRMYNQPPHAAIKQMADESLDLLRKYRLDEGRRKLSEIHGRLETLRETPESIFRTLEVWHFSALAYYYYLIEKFERAEFCLVLAHDAARRAMDLCDFLLPLAYVCSELAFQKIRIARSQRQWPEMAEQVEIVRGMLENRIPLCALRDGRPVYNSTLKEFCRGVPGITRDREELVERMFGEAKQTDSFARFVERIYVLPGFVIPCR